MSSWDKETPALPSDELYSGYRNDFLEKDPKLQFITNRNDPNRPQTNRINHQIRISPIRVVKDKEQLGVMPTSVALNMSQEEGLDLVEIAPSARPPVCHIMDFGKFRYEQSIREKENKKKQKVVQDKEIGLSPVVGDHDLRTKINQAKGFLNEGKKVQFSLKFKGRNIVHKELGFQVIDRVLASLEDISVIEMPPRLEGKNIICRLAPKS